jgi:hypothetical protein
VLLDVHGFVGDAQKLIGEVGMQGIDSRHADTAREGDRTGGGEEADSAHRAFDLARRLIELGVSVR